ncbi:hypothetical protein [Microvirga thermotolerans]|uniref:Uncharacterized protein n=1 Tax=Microvirga thermotolerans TaxID=2651334 RepID=A0A5P9JU46_9HYPH|nr:hypothetical protein [Microvirga thermotolerans]QFU15145.1 hypothetical protein GDR74_02350 [Microvirga thermotolerans]QFU15156.1 hypothetical protein GDR74_02405 [Microvirga thermotolerans]
MTTGLSSYDMAETAYELALITSGLLGPEGKTWVLDIETDMITFRFQEQGDLHRLRQRLDELLPPSVNPEPCTDETIMDEEVRDYAH